MLCVGWWLYRVLGVRGYVRLFSPMLIAESRKGKVKFRSGLY